MVIERFSLPSRSSVSISSAIALSSRPLASETARFAPSATPVTSTVKPELTVDVSPLASRLVAAISRSMLPLKSSGGVRVRPLNCPGESVHEPSPLFVPAESTAPSGTPEIVMDRVSLPPSRSFSDADRSSVIALSSAPLTSPAFRFGASATLGSSTSISSSVSISSSRRSSSSSSRSSSTTADSADGASCAGGTKSGCRLSSVAGPASSRSPRSAFVSLVESGTSGNSTALGSDCNESSSAPSFPPLLSKLSAPVSRLFSISAFSI